jgi:hypothetical protein
MRTVIVDDVEGNATLVRAMSATNDPRTLTTLPDILSRLSQYQSLEAELSNSLSDLLSSREPILASLARLKDLLPDFDELLVDAALLSERVTATAKTAQRVGGRVKSLDEEMGRVREAGERVGQVMELKVRVVVNGLGRMFHGFRDRLR